mmetsp:Transcript_23600/g.67644  ORF Transcript_23600/g.67644 Transcript_23600/m.67644 type:complete len:558 (+) Transcript_23600:37-1710(+)
MRRQPRSAPAMPHGLVLLLFISAASARRTADLRAAAFGKQSPRATALLEASASGSAARGAVQSGFPVGGRLSQLAPMLAVSERHSVGKQRHDAVEGSPMSLRRLPPLPAALLGPARAALGRRRSTRVGMHRGIWEPDPEYAEDDMPIGGISEELLDILFGDSALPDFEAEELRDNAFDAFMGDEAVFEQWLMDAEDLRKANGADDTEFEQGDLRCDGAMCPKLVFDETGEVNVLNLPKDWARLFVEGSLRAVFVEHGMCEVYVGLVKSELVNSGGSARVAVKVVPSTLRETQTEVRMLQRLRHSGNVVHLIASQDLGVATYTLMPAADETLESWLSRREDDALFFNTQANESLPLLIDLLRGVRDIHDAGIVHGAIAPENVLLIDGRPLFTDFESAVVIEASDEHFGHSSVEGVPSVSEYLLPPETIRGVPTGASNMIWQVGLIFARAVLGYIPTESAVWRHNPDMAQVSWTPDVDDSVQDFIRQNFSIEEDFGVSKLLGEDFRGLLRGMLRHSPEDRWDATTALAEAERVARLHGVPVPAERSPPEISVVSESDWE